MVLLGALVEVALDDSKVLLVEDGLHDEPGAGGFDEFGVQLVDAFLVRFGAEVCSKGRFSVSSLYVYVLCM